MQVIAAKLNEPEFTDIKFFNYKMRKKKQKKLPKTEKMRMSTKW